MTLVKAIFDKINYNIIVFVLVFSNFTSTYSQSTKVNGLNWSTKNLNVSKFNNGDNILHAKNEKDWLLACKNKEAAFIEVVNKLGQTEKLYNYYVLMDKRGVLPVETRYPTGQEFLNLSDFLINNVDKIKLFNFILSESFFTKSCENLSKDSSNDFWYLDTNNMPLTDCLEMDMGASMGIYSCGNEAEYPFCSNGKFTGISSTGGFGGLGSGKFIRFIYTNTK